VRSSGAKTLRAAVNITKIALKVKGQGQTQSVLDYETTHDVLTCVSI